MTSATTLARRSRSRALSSRKVRFASSNRARRAFVSRTLAISVRTVSSGVSPSMPSAAAVSGASASPPTTGAVPTAGNLVARAANDNQRHHHREHRDGRDPDQQVRAHRGASVTRSKGSRETT